MSEFDNYCIGAKSERDSYGRQNSLQHLRDKIEKLRLEVHVAALEKFMHMMTDSREEIPYINPVHLQGPL